MTIQVDTIILGQGLAGSAVAWNLHWGGHSIRIVDNVRNRTASRVSAGLITPVTGRRLVRSPEFRTDWTSAEAFYRRVEEATGQKLLCVKPMIRLFRDSAHRESYLTNCDDQERQLTEIWNGKLQANGADRQGLLISPAARLDVASYLTATARHFQNDLFTIDHDLDPKSAFMLDGDGISIPALGIRGSRLVVCTGSRVTQWFPEVPNNPVRGDILRVAVNHQLSNITHGPVWMAPDSDGHLTVGATYDWEFTSDKPTTAGRHELVTKLGSMLTGECEVIDHVSAVRPTMRDYEPVAGVHPEHSNVYVMGGLGSKGALKSPRLATELTQLVIEGTPIPESRSYRRLLRRNSQGRPRPLTQLAQHEVARVLQIGDLAVDATVGNGHDTCFLSEQVGDKGTVVGFDIQAAAIQSTNARLDANGRTNVTLHQMSHALMADVLQDRTVRAVMFNLGYLPGGDKQLITKSKSTGAAINASLAALAPGGIITLLVYRGHSGGQEEFLFIDTLLASLPDGYDVDRIDSTPPKPTAPVLFVVRSKYAEGST